MTEKSTILISKRLLLRQIADSDIDNIFKGLSHPDTIRYYGVSFQTLEETKEQMTFYADLTRNGTGIWFAVCSPDNKTFYGAGGLNGLDKHQRKAEIGFWLMPGYWGQGIMVEAMPLICDYGFDKLGLLRIEGFVESGNWNCKRAMAKLDFRFEGTMKDCEMKNGRLISLDVYALSKDGHSPRAIES